MASVVVEGLCSSSKGRLSYDRDWNTSAKQIQETLKRLSDQPTLSSSAFQTDSWRWRESSEGIQLDSPRNDSRSSTSTEGELEQPLNRTRHAFPLTPIALEQKLQTSKVNASLRQHEKEGERRVNSKSGRKRVQNLKKCVQYSTGVRLGKGMQLTNSWVGGGENRLACMMLTT
eukprot:m.26571 g.26571  ORF g.26571 m.26571 type:complete len:173 (+) comp29407_c0_seq6:18-536(+)